MKIYIACWEINYKINRIVWNHWSTTPTLFLRFIAVRCIKISFRCSFKGRYNICSNSISGKNQSTSLTENEKIKIPTIATKLLIVLRFFFWMLPCCFNTTELEPFRAISIEENSSFSHTQEVTKFHTFLTKVLPTLTFHKYLSYNIAGS